MAAKAPRSRKPRSQSVATPSQALAARNAGIPVTVRAPKAAPKPRAPRRKVTTQEREARNLARRAKRNNMNPGAEIDLLAELDHQQELAQQRRSRPAASAGHKPPVPMMKPRRPVYSQGTKASRAALARFMKKYRADRIRDQGRVRQGGLGRFPMTPEEYYAKWGHGDGRLRQMAERAARLEKTPNQQRLAPTAPRGRPF